MKPPWPKPNRLANLGAVAAREVDACAARVPRDRLRLPIAWQSDDHEGNFASSAWPCQSSAHNWRQPGTASCRPSKGDESKQWNASRQSCWSGNVNSTQRPAVAEGDPLGCLVVCSRRGQSHFGRQTRALLPPRKQACVRRACPVIGLNCQSAGRQMTTRATFLQVPGPGDCLRAIDGNPEG